MNLERTNWKPVTLLGLCLALLPGCGSSGKPAAEGSGEAAASANSAQKNLPPAAIGTSPEAQAQQGTPVPEKGSPEWFVGEMIVLQSEQLTDSKDPKEIEAARKDRNHKIIELASGVIARTHDDTSKESAFSDAVKFLVEARLQLALADDQNERDALLEDAAVLYKRNPSSKAAADAAFAVARYYHTNAQRYAKQEPRWLSEFAQQARLFAKNFPMHQSRAIQLLLSAGRSCELHGIRNEAAACYSMIQDKFPEAPHTAQLTAILRRLNLQGQKLELGGETPEGGFVKIEDYQGKVVLVAFWASDSPAFQEQIPQLSEIARKYDKKGLAILGVSLDEDETRIDQFMEQHPLPWTQIFSVDREKRRWNHPVVKAYGVQDIPLYWLVDQNGTVVNSQIQPEQFDSQIRTLLAKKSVSAQ